jgi:hypothetical protein
MTKHKKKRRNAGSGAAALGRRHPHGRRNASGGRSKATNAARNMAIAVGGGALGALAAGVAVGAGVNPRTAAIATLAGGALGAYALKGNAKVAAIGAACAASGQLALAWQVKRQATADAKKAEEAKQKQLAAAPAPQLPAAPKRNAADFDDDFEDPRNAGYVDDFDDDDLRNAVVLDEDEELVEVA